MKKVMFLALTLVMFLALTLVTLSCTQQKRARDLGGTEEIRLPKGEKLLKIFWRENGSLWYLTRAMRPGEKPEVYTFKESSKHGLIEGTITIRESK